MHKISLALILGLFSFNALAQEERASADDAKALLNKAASHYKASGRDKALSDFMDKSKGFHDRDLYVFCIKDGKTSAHGTNPAFVGKDVAPFKDPDGKAFATEMYERGMKDGQGQVEYKWSHPSTKKLEVKSSFFQKIGEDVCGVGHYKK